MLWYRVLLYIRDSRPAAKRKKLHAYLKWESGSMSMFNAQGESMGRKSSVIVCSGEDLEGG